MNFFQVVFDAGTDNLSTTIEWAMSELRIDEITKSAGEGTSWEEIKKSTRKIFKSKKL